MAGNWKRRAFYAALGLGVVGLTTWGLWPQPVAVDLAQVTRGPLEVTVDEEGIARIKEVFTVSAPVSGRLLRLPVEVGDAVEIDKTVVATIRPTAPAFLDVRSRREAEAAVAAARATLRLAEARVREAEAQLAFARKEFARARKLARKGTISKRAFDRAKLEVDTRLAALKTAQAERDMRAQELRSAEARLIQPGPGMLGNGHDTDCCVQIKAPATGRVLRIMQKSEHVVQAGTPLLEIGDPTYLEVVVDLLSSDAVRVPPGARARVEKWGGGRVLNARLRRVEPAGFMKVSALGIEEQRVRTILDLTDPPSTWRRLGHNYRVFVRITIWRDEQVLTIPLSALFRQGDRWAVFVVREGRARLRKIEIGQRNLTHAQVLSGLRAGDRVILHPSDVITDGTRVVDRKLTTG